MPGDRIPVPVVVTAAGPKVETDAAEHLLRRIYFPDGVPSVSGRPRRCCPDAAAERGVGRVRFPYRYHKYIVRYSLLVSFVATSMEGTHFRAAGRGSME